MQNINEIEELIKLIAKFPGLGPKSAKRIVLKLINNRDELVKPMANILAQVYKNVVRCQSCGTLKSNAIGCKNCENTNDKYNKICVVEDIADQWSIENSNIYRGYFHILGGTIATSATVEGQTTAYYIQDSLKKTNTKVTRLAQGLPVGGEIESLDDGTLYSAFKNRAGIKTSSS